MLDITDTIQTDPDAPTAAKALDCFVRRATANSYVVTPKRWGKTRRLVTFRFSGERLLAHCEDYYGGETCPANYFDLLCYHVRAAYRRAKINAEKEQRKAA